MKVVGLTGGIGSGKSTVAAMFKDMGIPIYIADIEAKELMHADENLKDQVKKLLGEESYKKDALNREFVASQVFEDPQLLQKLNALVHPAVAAHFEKWKKKQTGPYVIKEAAILFENGGYKNCDKTILVTAPEEMRIQRVLKRDRENRQKIIARINNQWTDDRKIKLADKVINNMGSLEETQLQVKRIHNDFINIFLES